MPVPGSRFGSLLTSRFRSDGGFDFRRRQQNLYRLSRRKKCVCMKKLRVFYMVRRLIWDKDGKLRVNITCIRVLLSEKPSSFSFLDCFEDSLRFNSYEFFEDEFSAERACESLSKLSHSDDFNDLVELESKYLEFFSEMEGFDGLS